MEYLLDPSYFVAYGTDGQHTWGASGAWSLDLERFLARMRADGAEVLRMPRYPDGETVQVVPASCSDRVAFLPERAPAELSIETGITWPPGAAVRRCFERLLRVDAAA